MKRLLGWKVLAGTLSLGLLLASAAASGLGQTKVSAAMLPVKAVGSKTAPITIEVFSDFQCPACKRFYMDTTRQLIKNYVETGKVYLVHHDFPLPIHAHAREAARWANAAAMIVRFQVVEDALYDKQETWATSGNIETVVASVLSPAEMKKVRLLLQNPQISASIEKDITLGQSKGVNQTPSIFVTHAGQTQALPPGGVNYPLMKQYLDYLLSH